MVRSSFDGVEANSKAEIFRGQKFLTTPAPALTLIGAPVLFRRLGGSRALLTELRSSFERQSWVGEGGF